MTSAEQLDSGIELSRFEELARQFPQFPIESDIGDMSDDTRADLLDILHEMRIMKILQHVDVPAEVAQQFLSIEEEFDQGASIAQKIKAGISWLRLAEMNLLGGILNTKNIRPPLTIYDPASEEPSEVSLAVAG
jgi:hypothetical protein